MEKKEFDKFTSKVCEKLKGMSKDQLVDFAFTISKCANYYYFEEKKN